MIGGVLGYSITDITVGAGIMLGVFVNWPKATSLTGYVVQENGCWDWVGSCRKGYGEVRLNGRKHAAHRLSYALMRGPIPETLTLDHLCRNSKCLNPWHLDPVTIAANIARAYGPADKCRPGLHLMTPENTYSARGWRECRECRRKWKNKPRRGGRAGR